MDAIPAPSWPPQDGTPFHTRTYSPHEVLSITLRLEGHLRTGTVLAHADRNSQRTVHVQFLPALRSGARDTWVWWTPDRMRLHVRTGRSPTETAPTAGDAIEVPAPAPYGLLTDEVRYPAGRWPQLEARVGSSWHPGLLLRRFRWGSGQSTAVVWMSLPAPAGWGALARYTRHYIWDPARTRARKPVP